MKILFITILTLCFSINISSAQSFDLGSWNVFNLKYNHSNKLSFFSEGQIRSLKFYNHFHYHEYKGGINYKISPPLQFTLGLGNYQTYKEGGNFELPKNNNEFRLWPQVILFQEIGNFKIEQRYRTELRWTSNGYRNRFRYRAALSYSFGKEINGYKPFQTSISNELFFTNNEPYFERNRIQLTLNYKPSKNISIQTGYLHQFDYKINDETGRDFLVIGFYFEVFGKLISQPDTDNQLKDN
jgi:long-subunit fatty acid transport protein